VSNKYFSDFRRIEFANSHSAASVINGWVSDRTNRRINGIVNAENINADTKLLIANAVYFKGEWLDKFKKEQTSPGTFYSNVENEYRINFMRKKEILPYYENEAFQFISKPYKSSDITFCILLPKERFGIEALEKEMTSDLFDKILDNAKPAKTILSMPPIKMESSIELSEILKNAGLKSAFTNEADFSGITNEKPVRIGQIIHKTWIELDEEKTEAAAATAMTVVVGAATQRDDSKVFKADHPFVFFILDNSNRAILFMGRYVIPSQGEKTEVIHFQGKQDKGEKIVKAKELPVLKVDFKKVSGHIHDSNSQPLPGVTVMIKGTTTGTISDLNGYYSIAVPENGGNMVVSFVGMKSQELQMKSEQIDIVLEQ
jgi:serpin B